MGFLDRMFPFRPTVTKTAITGVEGDAVTVELIVDGKTYKGLFSHIMHDAFQLVISPVPERDFQPHLPEDFMFALAQSEAFLTPLGVEKKRLEEESAILAKTHFKAGLGGFDTKQIIAERTRVASDIKFVDRAINNFLKENPYGEPMP